MRQKRIYIIIALLLLPIVLYAGNVTELFKHLKLEGIVNCDTTIKIPNICSDKPLVVEWGDNMPKHIGISLFTDPVKDIVGHDVCNFVERLFLELSLFPTTNEGVSYLNRKKIKFTCNKEAYGSGNFRSIKKLISDIEGLPSRFNVDLNNGTYCVILGYGVFNKIRIEFPSSMELVLGIDKSEQDLLINKKLSTNKPVKGTNLKVERNNLKEYTNDILVLPGTMFQIPKLRNDIYFDKKTVKPIFSKSHITESLNNLMLGVLDTNVRLEVTHRKYGVHTPDILVSLSNLFQSFSKDYKVYTGSQTLDDGRIQCVTVFHNQIYNYLHLLIVTATEGQYFDDKSVLDADFFSNIPQHNIKHLF